MQYFENKTATDVWAAWEAGAHVVVPFFHKDANPNGERTQSGHPLAWLGTNVISRGAEERAPYIASAFADWEIRYLPSVRMFAWRYDLPREDQFVEIRRASWLRGAFPVIWPAFVMKPQFPTFVDFFTAYFNREPQMEFWDGIPEPNIHRPPTPEEIKAAEAAKLAAARAQKKLYWTSLATSIDWMEPIDEDR